MFFVALLAKRELEIADLKQKIAEVLALMPASSYNGSLCISECQSTPLFASKFSPPHEEDVLAKSSLNPNASDYTPKTM